MSSFQPRDLLVVTYHFPPIQSAGVYRIVGLVKYLAARGWRITVLTVRRSTHEGGDDTLLDMIPAGIDVIRTHSPEPAARLMRAFGAPAENARQRSGATFETRSPASPETKGFSRRVFARPGRWMVDALSYPDYQIGWMPHVAQSVRAFIRRHPGAVVLSSTPPHSTQLAVRWARACSRFAWVADFRDPWTAPLRQPKGRANLALQRALERWVLSGCDGVIANTHGNRERLLASFPRLDPERVSVVTNAFDTDTLPAAAGTDDPALGCDLAYFGEIYPGMLDAYFEAARILVARDATNAPRLHVFGRVGAADLRRVQQSELASHIVFMGSVSYPRSLALMQSSRSLLLLLPSGDSMATCVPSKLYPYLFSGRPVLALVPPGDAARLVDETGAGETVTTEDSSQVAGRLTAFVARVRAGEARSMAALAGRRDAYTMQRAADCVHDILCRVADGR